MPQSAAFTSPLVARGLVELVDAFGEKQEVAGELRDALAHEDEPWLEPQLEERFWRAAAQEESLRDFGLLAPRCAPTGAFGAVELAALSAPDVRSALRSLAATSDVLHGDPIFDLAERDDGSAAMIYRSPHARASAGGAMAAELALASVVELVRRASGESEASPISAHVVGTPHARPLAIEHDIGCALHTNAGLDRLELSRELLETALRTPDARMHRLAMRLISLERARALLTGTPSAVRGLLRDVVLSPEPALGELARRTGMSPRALRARLAAKQTKTRMLLDEARRAAADRMLVAGARPTDVQRALGYSDLASLRRAFRRWWGTGPLARAKVLTGAPEETDT